MNPGKQSCINLILTSKRHIFQNSSGIETHLSDFHRMILTATKITFQKFRPRLINYSDYKYFGINISVMKIIENTYCQKYLTLVLALMIVVSVNFFIYVE